MEEHNPGNVVIDKAPADRPHAADWIWRPWYAKLYWFAAAFYWIAFLASWIWRLAPDIFGGVTGAYLGAALHPVTGLVVLGFGFVRAFFSAGEWEWAELTHEEMFSQRSVGGLSDPYSDPADPRSGMLWVGSPRNRARLFGDQWP
ncbi:MAG TPA: hypothetical protein VF503_24270 [Sphingobium sp.]|uniref:hypothetical protein n=1 Tax=Sphingobium sp. TaxID=1912891 RepID=UPI002ED0372F